MTKLHLCSDDLNCPPSTSTHTPLHYYASERINLKLKVQCYSIDCYQIDSIFYVTDKLIDNLPVEYNLNKPLLSASNNCNDSKSTKNLLHIDKVALSCINSKASKRRRILWNCIDSLALRLENNSHQDTENKTLDFTSLNWHSLFCFYCQFRVDFVENQNFNEILYQFFNHFLIIHKLCLKTKLDYLNFLLIKNIENLALFVMADFSLKFGGVLFDEEESIINSESDSRHNLPKSNENLLNIVKRQSLSNGDNDNKSLNESASPTILTNSLLTTAAESYANGLFNCNGLILY